MASTVPYMSVSLDGFIAGPNESWENNPLSDDGGYLHDWFPAGVTPGDATPRHASENINRQIFDELNATRAIVAGPGTLSRPAAAAAITMTACRATSTAATKLGRYGVRHGA